MGTVCAKCGKIIGEDCNCHRPRWAEMPTRWLIVIGAFALELIAIVVIVEHLISDAWDRSSLIGGALMPLTGAALLITLDYSIHRRYYDGPWIKKRS